MTETITEPQAPPEESTPTPASSEASKGADGKKVEHTAGGFPVIPLSLSGTNTAAGLLATAALAGGPIAVAVAMTGAAVLGTAAVHHGSKSAKKNAGKQATAAAARTASGNGGRGLLGRIPSQPRTTPRNGGSNGAGARKAAGGHPRHRSGGRPAGRSGSTLGKTGKPSARQRAARALGDLAGGRAGQVQALRTQAKAQSPTRAAARSAAVQARRQVADTRRAAKAANRTAATKTSPASRTGAGKARGPAARTLAKTMRKAAAVRDKAVAAGRTARDRSAGWSVAAGRQGVREAAHRARVAQLKAPAQKAARKALRRSAARFQARRAAAAALAMLLGALGMVTTPLGRKLRWAWLQHPGRRLYRFLLGQALAEREDRDADIRARLEEDEKAAEEQAASERDQDNDTEQIGDKAARPAAHVPAPPTSEGAPMDSTSGFRFEELAAEMEQAAQSYEPESAMEILAMVEGLPEALASIANIMQMLAERSDTEFPLDKTVADGFSDIYGALNAATAVAEDLGPAFRQAHEQDIARHEDPRNGPEAEKGWNV
ncbi:hypothetical protein [Streptomyces subrutilus]|uniref:Uncharacterized protein n=1 Tax=Streptomyces subrutilus TaxID=36818 RepID=A0A1E5PUK1_9ACTN|nr:hypothetical protein [Streptomyces subrutilus]OEJ33052.1 hypothetical protein BGK67_18540 [Streptomyces subrutilus]